MSRLTVYETWVPPTSEACAAAWVLLTGALALCAVVGVLVMGLRGGRR